MRTEDSGRLPLFLRLSAVILGASYLLFAIDLGTSFPKGVDALSYHLPMALRWLQEASLRISADKNWHFSLPGNAEIVSMLGLAAGQEFLGVVGSCISSLVLAIAVYPLALRLSGGSKTPALAAMLIMFSIPIIEFQTFSAYVDIFGTAFLFAALTLFAHRNRLCDSHEGPSGGNISYAVIIASALSCGLSLGTKPTFLPYCGSFLGTVIYLLWRDRHIHNKPLPLLVTIFVVGAFIPSAFWSLRAIEATGNPIYPIPLSIGTHVIFRGYEGMKILVDEPPGGARDYGDKHFVRHPSEWWIYPWTEWLNNLGFFPTAYGEGSGLGGAFAAFVTVGMVFAVSVCLGVGKVARLTRGALLALFLWLVVWLFGMHRVLRFGMPILVLSCLIAVPAIARLIRTLPRHFAIVFVCAVSTTCAISSLVPLHGLVGRVISHRWSRPAVYGYPELIDTFPPGTRVLNDSVFRVKNFALAGTHLTNKVVTDFEAPSNLTPEFIGSRRVDYVVRIMSADQMTGEENELIPLETPAGVEVYQSTIAGLRWRVWKVSHAPH